MYCIGNRSNDGMAITSASALDFIFSRVVCGTYETFFLLLLWAIFSGAVIVNGAHRKARTKRRKPPEIYGMPSAAMSRTTDIANLKPIIDEARAYREASQRENERKHFGETITFLALIAAAVIGVLQWRILSRTDATLQNQQRSYMFAAPGGAFNVVVDSPPLQGYVRIGNSGQSIARNVIQYMAVRIFPSPGPPYIDDINQMTMEEETPTFAPPVSRPYSANCPEGRQSAVKTPRRSTAEISKSSFTERFSTTIFLVTPIRHSFVICISVPRWPMIPAKATRPPAEILRSP